MPVDVNWYEAEEKNIIYTFAGRWTWEECFTALDRAASLLDSIDYSVMLIVDFRQTSHMPAANFESLNRIARAKAANHRNTRGILVLGLKHGILMVYKVFHKIFPKAASRYQAAKDEAELAILLSPVQNQNV